MSPVASNIPFCFFKLSNTYCSATQVMNASFEVFSSWDDEFDRLQGMLRDLVKKKREEHLRMVWRVNPTHKRLQGRIDHMRK